VYPRSSLCQSYVSFPAAATNAAALDWVRGAELAPAIKRDAAAASTDWVRGAELAPTVQ